MRDEDSGAIQDRETEMKRQGWKVKSKTERQKCNGRHRGTAMERQLGHHRKKKMKERTSTKRQRWKIKDGQTEPEGCETDWMTGREG